jgi:hypothetical protein
MKLTKKKDTEFQKNNWNFVQNEVFLLKELLVWGL